MSFLGLFGATTDDESSQEGRRPLTRSQSRETPSHLEINSGAISSFNGVARGRRTPSPRPIGHNANSAVFFQYDSTNVSQQLLQPQQQQRDADDFADPPTSPSSSSIMPTDQQSIEQLRASAAAAIEAANAATAALTAAAGLVAQQQQPAQQIRTRKPELPEFDSRNVEVWIRRVASAYDRAGIVLPKDKFAFLENKFAVGANPAIDAFLYGPATEEAWSDFLSYLKEEYGRTIRQEAQFLRGQFSRDGKKPTQMLAQIKDKAKRVSIDDIMKEIVISSLPPSVQQMIQERVRDMTADETAAVADRYFDQDGRPLHSSTPTIQNVDAPQVEITHAGDRDDNNGDDKYEINAIRGRRGNNRGRSRGFNNNNNNRSARPFNNNNNNNNGGSYNNNNKHRSNFTPAFSNPTSNSSSTPSASASSSRPPVTCMNHQRYGDKTYTCQQGCAMWKEFQQRQAGKGNAGKRQ